MPVPVSDQYVHQASHQEIVGIHPFRRIASQEFKQLIRKNSENLSSAFDSFQHISEKLSSAIDKLDNMSTVVDTLSVYMESGEGTFAKLVKSDDLYNELRTTNAHLDSFITDFRLNPGKYTRDMNFKIRLF